MHVHPPETVEKYKKIGVWGDDTLLDRFGETVNEYPGRTAIVDPPNKEDLVGLKPERLTYGELNSKINAFATSLIERGIEKDDVVITQLPNTWELAMLYLGVARAGAIISPIPIQWRRRELESITNVAGAKAFITLEEFHGYRHVDMGKEVQSKFPGLEHVILLQEVRSMSKDEVDEEELSEVKVDANDVFNIQWSSGTEAEPKGCPMTHNNWFSNFVPLLSQMKEGWTTLCAAPLVNMAAIVVTYVPWLLTKGTLVLHHPIDIELLIKQMMEEKVNFTLLIPAMLNMILKHPHVDEFDLSHVNVIDTGAAPPSEWALAEFKERWNIEIINIWGQNEGTMDITGPLTTPLEKRVDKFPQFGKKGVDWGIDAPIINAIEMKVVDPETGEELTDVGEVGELSYKGPLRIPCYFNQPHLTEKAFDEEGYFHTGDLFKIEEDDFISFFERKKDIIIRGGVNISAQEVENLALKHPKVKDAAAVAMPDPVLGEKTCIYIMPKEEETVTLDDITSLMEEEEVAKYKWPERLEIVDKIPRNPVGKILKIELREDIEEKLREKGKID